MGTRESEQASLWIATSDLPASPGHPFYTRLNAILDAHGFDRFVEEPVPRVLRAGDGPAQPAAGPLLPAVAASATSKASTRSAGSRGGPPTRWRSAVSCAWASTRPPPDHSTISRTRRLIDVETHRAVFTWVQDRLVEAGCSRARRSPSMRPRSRPTPRCAASCGGTRGRAIRVPDAAREGLGHRDADA